MSLVCRCAGRTVRPLRAELQECLFWLCRWTALHWASLNGHTETAMALVKAGADVHCKDNDGYGCSGCIVVSVGLPLCGGGRSVLCRQTALYFASLNGHTETAMALVKAGADVHCKTNHGCAFSGLHPRVITSSQ